MEDPSARLAHWWREGATVVVATVCRTWRSAPRRTGSRMLVGPDDQVVGSVSGGCVEASVYEVAREVRRTGRPVLHRYGVSDADAFEVGLSCGGEIEVFVERVSPQDCPSLSSAMDGGDRPQAVATVVAHADPARVGAHLVMHERRVEGSLGSAALDSVVVTGVYRDPSADPVTWDLGDVEPAARVLVVPKRRRPRLIVCGASDLVAALTHLAHLVGFHVTVCDARPAFASARRFPYADQVVTAWPDAYLSTESEAGRLVEGTALAVLTHDPKFDVPILQRALGMPALAFVGLLGSRRTCADRRERLLAAGVPGALLARLRAPIGLDLGAATPQETAVSILAEILAARHGGSGSPLSTTSGPLHRAPSPRLRSGGPRLRSGGPGFLSAGPPRAAP